jgi:hypothetical protein
MLATARVFTNKYTHLSYHDKICPSTFHTGFIKRPLSHSNAMVFNTFCEEIPHALAWFNSLQFINRRGPLGMS